MKYLIIFLALVAIAVARPDDDYSRYENVDVAVLIGNKRLMSSYTKCFVDEGKCVAEAADFKKMMPDALQSNCNKCSEHQKTLIARVIEAIIDQLPEDWEKLNQKYNPDGKFDEGIKKFVDKYAKIE